MRFSLLCLLAVCALALTSIPAFAQTTVRIAPAASTVAGSGDTFSIEVRIDNYTDLYGYRVEFFYNTAAVSHVSNPRVVQGTILNPGGGSLFLNSGSSTAVGRILVDHAILGSVSGVTGTNGLAFTVQFDGVAPGGTDWLYTDVRLRNSGNVPIPFVLESGTGAVSIGTPSSSGSRRYTALATSATYDVLGTSGVSARVENAGAITGMITGFRYNREAPGGDGAPFSDPDGRVTTLGVADEAYWEVTSSLTGAAVNVDLAFSTVGLSGPLAPDGWRVARRAIGAGGADAWTLVPVAQTTVNTGTNQVRIDNAAGTNGAGQYALVFQATASSTAAGWRMLAAPVAGLSVQALTDLNLVGGIAGDPTCAANPANLFTGYTGGQTPGGNDGYTQPGAYSDIITPGKGFFWYFFALGANAGPCGTGATASAVQPLPITLSATGTSPTTNVATTFAASERVTDEDTFYLVGNPFGQGLDLDGTGAGLTSVTAADANGNVPLQNVVQIWDAAAGGGTGGYAIKLADTDNGINGTGGTSTADDISVWQGFWVERTNTARPTYPLTMTYSAANRTGSTSSGVFVGRGAEALRALRFEVSGSVGAERVFDGAALVLFAEGATAAWDAYDASKLGAFSSPFALLAPVGQGRDGVGTQKAVESLPLDLTGALEIPLAFYTSGTGTFELRWPETAVIPAEWTLTLTDRVTGQTVDLRSAEAYAFDANATDDWTERFTVAVAASVVGTEDRLESGFVVSTAYPNPARSSATVTVEVSDAQVVRAEVYNVLGQRVATVLDGPLSPSTAVSISIDTARFAAGNYVVRITGETFVESRRLTVVR